MGRLSAVLRGIEGGGLLFWCPGPRWLWNGSAERPTFQPSVLVRYDGADADVDGAPPSVCHSFVVDGAIQFLGDCTHALAGQTVPLPRHWK